MLPKKGQLILFTFKAVQSMQKKSANRLWRESGTTLSFKDWIEREKIKFNKPENENTFLGVNGSINQLPNQIITKNTESIFGLSPVIVIVSGVIVVASIGFYFYKRYKKNG